METEACTIGSIAFTPNSINPNEDRIIEVLQSSCGWMSGSQISRKAGISEKSVYPLLRSMSAKRSILFRLVSDTEGRRIYGRNCTAVYAHNGEYTAPKRNDEESASAIVREAASVCDVPLWLVLSKSRTARAKLARHISARILHERGASYSAIGRLFGRDHTTISYNDRISFPSLLRNNYLNCQYLLEKARELCGIVQNTTQTGEL